MSILFNTKLKPRNKGKKFGILFLTNLHFIFYIEGNHFPPNNQNLLLKLHQIKIGRIKPNEKSYRIYIFIYLSSIHQARMGV